MHQPLTASTARSRKFLARASKPERRGQGGTTTFRRSEVARFKLEEDVTALAQPARLEQLWERYAIPGGFTIFWIVFVASNWQALRQLLG